MRASDVRAALGAAFAADLDLSARASGSSADLPSHIDTLTASAVAIARERKLVYTAFDGDHQQLGPLMRALAFTEGATPVNPDSILDYRETLVARATKRGVLLDDLSILRGCHELWVFTDAPADASALSALAEGVLVELLFFLKRNPHAAVYFISVKRMIAGGNIEKTVFQLSYQDAKAALPPDSAAVLALANSGVATDVNLRVPIYFITDPADFKYSRFLLASAYNNHSGGKEHVPVVPSLAVQVGDVPSGYSFLGDLVLCWIRLIFLCGKCYMFSSIDGRRSPSVIAAILHRAWLREPARGPIENRSWASVNVPRAKMGSLWALTDRERREASEEQS